MAKRKSSSRVSGNPFHKSKLTKAEVKDSALFCQLPFIKDTRREPYHDDAGLYWWHVTEPIYWHQAVVTGEAFADRVAAILPQNPQRIEEVLRFSLHAMLSNGGAGGVATGFLDRLAHYACKGMMEGAKP